MDGGKLEISIRALTQMREFVQDAPYKREAGGVLLGRYIRESLDIVVDEVTVPMWGDRRGWFNFFRARRPHQKAIDRAWQESGGTTTYLGEWHTHPECVPTPSPTDLKDWERQLKKDVFDGDSLYFIIIGIDSLRIWEFNHRNLTRQLIGDFWYLEA